MQFLCFDINIKDVGWNRLDRELERLIRSGNFISAIKLHRERTQSSLKDARDYCWDLREKLGLTPPGALR